MPYESTVTFTLDTICPWTYLGFARLTKALASYRASNPSSPATFTLKLAPYQLYPDFSQEGQDRYEWYKNEKYDGSEKRMEIYSVYMANLGRVEGIEFDFGTTTGATIANTLHAHRILQWLQDNKSAEAALKALASLYEQYFTHGAHPSCPATLLTACMAAGVSEEEAKTVVEDGTQWMVETKMGIREQTGNGVDSVPYVVFEGRRRDFTLIGAKEVPEYEKVLAQVAKECL